LAGNALCDGCSAKLYDGNAPDAKLYFIDAGSPDMPGELDVDFGFDEVFGRALAMGSGIMSASWGWDPDEPEVREMFDEIGYKFPLLTFFFASGNSHRSFEIWSPGNSKNAVAVAGCTKPAADSALGDDTRHDVVFVSAGGRSELAKQRGKNILRLLASDPIPSFVNLREGVDFVVVQNETGCATGGNHRLLILDREYIECRNDLPALLVSPSLVSEIVRIGQASVTVNFTSEGKGPTVTLGGYSSTGPSITGLLKPDVVAPGSGIVSAAGRTPPERPTGCTASELIAKSGTSMATPHAAGIATLVRQYFRDGFYPYGVANVSSSVILSSDGMKAVLVNCGGAFSNGNRQMSMDKGGGVIHATNTLVFADEPRTAHFGMRITSGLVFREGMEGVTSITTTSSEFPLVLSIAWLDPPTGFGNRSPVFADIDLYVETPGGDIIYGNQLGDYEDSHSTVEKIVINDPAVGTYQVFVRCPDLTMSTDVPTTLVISGPLPHLDFDLNSRFIDLAMRSNKRECAFDRTGTHCQEIVGDAFGSIVIPSRRPIYRMIHVPESVNPSDEFVITVRDAHRSRGVFHVEIAAGQVAKFGGDLLYFAELSQSTVSISISIGDHPEIQPNSWLYLTLYEAVGPRTVSVTWTHIPGAPLATPSHLKTTTDTPVPSLTHMATATQTPAPTPTHKETAAETPVPSLTHKATATHTPALTPTHIVTSTETPIPTGSQMETAPETLTSTGSVSHSANAIEISPRSFNWNVIPVVIMGTAVYFAACWLIYKCVQRLGCGFHPEDQSSDSETDASPRLLDRTHDQLF
jgi:hypothetical protein